MVAENNFGAEIKLIDGKYKIFLASSGIGFDEHPQLAEFNRKFLEFIEVSNSYRRKDAGIDLTDIPALGSLLAGAAVMQHDSISGSLRDTSLDLFLPAELCNVTI